MPHRTPTAPLLATGETEFILLLLERVHIHLLKLVVDD